MDYNNIEICELIAQERQCTGSKGRAALKDLYYEDAMVITSWLGKKVPVQDYISRGRDPLKADTEKPVVGRIGYPVVHRNGNRAYVEVPQVTTNWVIVNGEKAVLTVYMRLIYCVEKRVDVWKITDFSSIYEGDTLTPEIPGTDLHVDAKEVVQYRRSFRYMSYVNKNVPQTLAGADQPVRVKEIYAQLEEWIGA